MNHLAYQKAKDNLSIAVIYLRATTAYLNDEFDPSIPNQELIAQFNIGIKSYAIKELEDENNNKHKVLVYQTEARMRYLKAPLPEHLENDQQLDSLTVSEIVALFTSEYIIKCDEDLAEDAINEFGRINVPHQVWPYWREYSQSTCARMYLPISIMPMYIINQKTEESFESKTC
ncbi:MAG: hypothetical protein ABL903_14095 [Methylococcales bacterium]